MSGLAVAAGALALLLGAAHSYLGERYLLIRLFRRPDLPTLFGGTEFTRRTLRFAWHLTTVAWFGLAAVLIAVARAETSSPGVAEIIAATFAASGVVALVGSRGRHLSWLAFFAIAGLAWAASR